MDDGWGFGALSARERGGTRETPAAAGGAGRPAPGWGGVTGVLGLPVEQGRVLMTTV